MKLSKYIDEYYDGIKSKFAKSQVNTKGNELRPQDISKWERMNAEVIYKNSKFQVRFATGRTLKSGQVKISVKWRDLKPPRTGLAKFRFEDFSEECPVVLRDQIPEDVILLDPPKVENQFTIQEFIDKHYDGVKSRFADDQKNLDGSRMTAGTVTKLIKNKSLKIVEIDGKHYIMTVSLRPIKTPTP